jgi:hypothetical protein
VVDQHLHWYPGSSETGCSRESIGVDPHDFLQSAKEFRSHTFTLPQSGATLQAARHGDPVVPPLTPPAPRTVCGSRV